MKYFVLFALAAVVAARPDGGDKPKPRPRGPLVFVRPLQRAAQDETYEFRFGVAGLKPLDVSEVHLLKVVKGEKGPELKETDFDIKMKTLTAEEIKDWMEKNKEEYKDDDEDGDSSPKPRPQVKHAIAGKVSVSSASCDDQGPYLIRYGSRDDREDRDEDKDEGDKRRPRRRPRGAFLLLVKGCKGPEPDDGDRPHGPAVFVRPLQRAAQDETYEFRFGVAGLKPLDVSEVHLWKVVKGEKGPELKETDFDIKMKTLTAEEIKDWMEKHKEEYKDDDEDGDGRPKPRPQVKHAIAGKVSVSSASCDDQGPYLIRYGSRDDREDREDKDEGDKRRPRRRPRGAFLLLVKGCRGPEPKFE